MSELAYTLTHESSDLLIANITSGKLRVSSMSEIASLSRQLLTSPDPEIEVINKTRFLLGSRLAITQYLETKKGRS